MPKGKPKKSKAALAAEQKLKEEEEERRRIFEEEEKEKLRQKQLEEEKQRQIFIQKRDSKFEQNVKDMDVIRNERKARLVEEMRLIDEANKWQQIISCDEVRINKIDEIGLNSFLYEYRIINGEDVAVKDLIQFCDKIHDLKLGLHVEFLHHRSSIESEALHAVKEVRSKATEFISKCFALMNTKVDVITMNCMKIIDDVSNEGVVTTAESRKSGFGIAFYKAKKKLQTHGQLLSNTFQVLQTVGVELSHSDKAALDHDMMVRVLKASISTSGMDDLSDFVLVNNCCYHVDVISVSSPTKKVGDWTIGSSQKCESHGANCGAGVKISILYGKNLVDSKGCRVVRLSDDHTKWTDNGLNNVKFDSISNRVEFDLVCSKSIVALVKDKPKKSFYKHWSIRQQKLHPYISKVNIEEKPADHIATEISLQTFSTRVKIQVSGNSCFLIEPKVEQVADLLYLPFPPERLLLELDLRGVHLLPVMSMDNEDILNRKTNEDIENRFVEDVSLLSCAYDICAKDQESVLNATYKIQESDHFTGCRNIFPMYQVAMCYDKNMTLNASSGAIYCSIINPKAEEPDRLSRTDLFPMFTLNKLCSPESKMRLLQSAPSYSETVRGLLQLMNLIGYSE